MKNLERLNRARVRARVRRILASREETEHEGGELNLVPYLDILVNTIIFLLATTVSVVPLAHVRTDAPHYAPPPRHADRPSPAPPPEGLNLTVAVTGSSFIVAGTGGVLPTVPCRATETPGQRCSHDFAALTHLAAKIKQHNPDERRVHITADARVPYAVVVRTMDALRGRSTGRCTGQDGCLFDRVVFAAGVK